MSTPLLVVAAALIGSDGSVLLHRRALKAVHGGLWEFPGGKVSAGETAEIAMVRELEEELNIQVEAADLEPIAFASGVTEGQSLPGPLVILLYSCRKWTGEPRCMEGEAIDWIDPVKIEALDMPPLDYPLARQLVAWLSRS